MQVKGALCGTIVVPLCDLHNVITHSSSVATSALTQEFQGYEEGVAGVAGFEPAHGDTKNRCLTAWLHPNERPFSSEISRQAQELILKNVEKSVLVKKLQVQKLQQPGKDNRFKQDIR